MIVDSEQYHGNNTHQKNKICHLCDPKIKRNKRSFFVKNLQN
ncbi:hypothetical protein appser4_14800, partial [Actinobacillus pleuropneumoniae serovar 4 str. M62]